MKCDRKMNRHLVRVVLFTAVLMLLVGGVFLVKAHADEFGGYQGSINGGIPAITRVRGSGKLFGCNQYRVLRGQCSIVEFTPDGRYALVHLPGDRTCAGGMYGVINRDTGDVALVVTHKGVLSIPQHCDGHFSAAFVDSPGSTYGYGLALQYNNKTVQFSKNISF